MRRTHLSLYYLAGYLVPAGLLLLFVPEFATKLLLSNRTYDYAPFHLAGVLLLVIGILIVQIIRYRLEQLYATTLVARGLISATLLWLFLTTGDPGPFRRLGERFLQLPLGDVERVSLAELERAAA